METNYRDYFANSPERCGACDHHECRATEDPCDTCIPGTATDHWIKRSDIIPINEPINEPLKWDSVSPENILSDLQAMCDEVHSRATKQQTDTYTCRSSWAEKSDKELLIDMHEAYDLMMGPRRPEGGLEVKFCPKCNFRWIRPSTSVEIGGIRSKRWVCASCDIAVISLADFDHIVEHYFPQTFMPKIECVWTI